MILANFSGGRVYLHLWQDEITVLDWGERKLGTKLFEISGSALSELDIGKLNFQHIRYLRVSTFFESVCLTRLQSHINIRLTRCQQLLIRLALVISHVELLLIVCLAQIYVQKGWLGTFLLRPLLLGIVG